MTAHRNLPDGLFGEGVVSSDSSCYTSEVWYVAGESSLSDGSMTIAGTVCSSDLWNDKTPCTQVGTFKETPKC